MTNGISGGLHAVDSLIGQFVHSASKTTGGNDMTCEAPMSPSASSAPLKPLSELEIKVLATAPEYLNRALLLKKWFDRVDKANEYQRRFELTRTVNRADSGYGFFDSIQTGGETLPVMGNVQEMFYDQPRTPADQRRSNAIWMRDQVREFVLRYFMRVSSFRRPEAYEGTGAPTSSWPGWCSRNEELREGFGFSQLFYKLRGSGVTGRFAPDEQSRIADLREIGARYEWIIAKVRIFDFAFTFRPLGQEGPQVAIDLKEESYIILSPEFIVARDNPAPGVLGDYGIGYAFIRNPEPGALSYGPGQFDRAFQLIHFRVLETGEAQVRMTFVANRATGAISIDIDPVKWGFRLADSFSFGLTSKVLAPVKSVLETLPGSSVRVDPVYSYIRALDALTRGRAARDWCISRDQLDKDFLIQHFQQHYQTVIGSLLTWRQIPNWLDAERLPRWVVDGRNS